jgi:uncharacterized protein involved in outer membrane biogenesis
MGKISKKLYWAGTGAAFLLVIVLALAFIVPRLVDSAWLKKTIRTEMATQVDGDLDFQKAEFALLPVPAILLQQVSFSIPETVRIHLETLKVYPRLLPLLLGKIAISKIIVENPDFSLPLQGKPEKKEDQKKTFSFSELLESTSAKLTPILAAIHHLEVVVHKGTLRFLAGKDEVFLFADINGSFTANAERLTTAISCTSTLWESLELQSTLVPGNREGNGRISLKNIHGKALADYFLPEKSPLLGESLTGLDADFTFNPETGLTADIQSSGSSVTLLRENEEIAATIENLKGSIQYSDQISAITVDDLSFSSPRIQLSGSFQSDRSIPHASLDITSQNADITDVREVLPVFINTFYGDLPVVQELFDITRGGTISQAHFHIEGEVASDLAVFESMRIQAHVQDGNILLSDLGLDLQGVSGDVIIADTILEGRNLRARLDNSTGSNGSLKLGLVKKETTPFHLDLELIADLAEVPPLLKKLLPGKQVLEYLSLFESVEGTGQGRLTLGQSLESLSTSIAMNTIAVQVDFTPVPYPITISGGRILIEGLKTESFNLQGKIGKSTFSNYSSRINFEAEPTIEVESGSFHMVLDEMFPWLATDKRLQEELQNMESVTGLAAVIVKDIKGPLLQPAKLHYDLQYSLENVTLTTSVLPGPLTIQRGQGNITPDRIVFENLQAQLLDSSLTYSGVLLDFISGTTNAELIVTSAEIGREVNTWFAEQIRAPREYMFRSPLLVSGANAKWTRGELLDLQGDFSIRDGPIFSVDIMLNPDEMVLRNLSFNNGNDQARIALDLKKRAIGAEIHGSLSKKTIDAILLHNDAFPDAWIEGDITLHLDMDSPGKSFASGGLDGGDFLFPWKLDKPLRFDSFSLAASDKTLTVNGAEAVFAGRKYAISGQADLTEAHLSMDFDLSTDTVELDKILGLFKVEREHDKETGKRVGKSWDLDLAAQVNIHADSLLYKGYTWTPFESQITYKNSSLGIEVLKAELCNLSTPGKLSFQDGQISLDFTMEANEQEFKEILVCLEGGEQQMTGILDLKATIRGEGNRETLVNSLQGELQYSAQNGYIYQDAQAAKLLSFLNVTDIFRGKIPDLKTSGFHYDSLIVKGTMENGVLAIAPAKLEAPIMQIAAHGTIDIPREKVNLQVLVAPMQTVNKIQNMLPIIRTILPSSLVAVPVEVKGDFSEIKVRTLSMSALTTRVFNVMVDALSSPVRILEGTSPE